MMMDMRRYIVTCCCSYADISYADISYADISYVDIRMLHIIRWLIRIREVYDIGVNSYRCAVSA